MKKISLKNVKETLTRAEMKAINGGSGDGNCCAVIMEFGHNWMSCGLTQQEAESAVCKYTDPYYNSPYPGSYWTCSY